MEEQSSIRGTVDAWEKGELGMSGAHVRRAPPELMEQIDEALCLKPISIRLPKNVIDTFKLLAQLHNTGYQPLMRDALCRFAEAEMKQLLITTVKSKQQSKTPPATPVPFADSEIEPDPNGGEEIKRAA